MMTDWPREIREPLIERHVSPEWIMDGYKLVHYRDRFLDELRQAGPLPDVPLILLTAMDIDDFKKAVSDRRVRGAAARGDRGQAAALHGHWPHRSRAARTASSTAPDTPPSTGAVPTRYCMRSGT